MRPSRRISRAALSSLLKNQSIGDSASGEYRIKRLRKTQNSSLYLISSDESTPIIVKELHSGDPSEQYRSLVTVSEKLLDPRYRVPNPITCFVDEQLICMEYIEGPSIDTTLLSSDVCNEIKVKSIQESGRWLARFHSIRIENRAAVDMEKKQHDLDSYINLAAKHYKHDSVMNQAVAWLEKERETAGTIATPHGIVHGDFKPENLLFENNAIVGLDFLAENTGPQIMDLAQFINQLKFLGMRAKLFGKKRLINDWIELFLNAYQESQPEVSELLLQWFTLHHLVRYWAIQRTRKNPVGFLQSLWLRHEIKAALEL